MIYKISCLFSNFLFTIKNVIWLNYIDNLNFD